MEPRQLTGMQKLIAPFKSAVFARIWAASLFSHFGFMILIVGAAWAMTELTSNAELIALVQTSMMLPIMFFAVVAGAIADMYDRRVVAIVALLISMTGGILLATCSLLGLLNPMLLLAFCFLIGCGQALFQPSWQASVSDQVPRDLLAYAISMNSIAFNVARSVGPALGGILVAAFGATLSFTLNALFFLPMLIVFYLWKRPKDVSRLPSERIGRAVASGVRYIAFSPSILIVLFRTFLFGIFSAAIMGVMPLIARDMLNGTAETYGIILGAYGVGALAGTFIIPILRERFQLETNIRTCMLTFGGAVLVVANSHFLFLTVFALLFAGAATMISVMLFNISIQLTAPRWVAGRCLAVFHASIAGGAAIGSWGLGFIAEGNGTQFALLLSGCISLLLPLIGLKLRLPQISDEEIGMPARLEEPEIALELTSRSGPITMEIDYRIDPAQARAFYRLMQDLQAIRQRNGAHSWSLARDVTDPWNWTERYQCPTWLDYLHQRNRPTQAEHEIQLRILAMDQSKEGAVRIRRMLERPFGSVRWEEDVPDRAPTEIIAMSD